MNRRFNDIYRGKGRIVRKRSPEHVVEEILRVRADYGLEFVRFVDDTLVMSKLWLSDFLSLYREKVRLPFSCTMRADTACWLFTRSRQMSLFRLVGTALRLGGHY